MKIQTAESFWARVQKADGDGCWLLPGARSTSAEGNYRQLNVAGRRVAAHRYAYETAVGPIPDGLDILHRCDNRGCVRPDHLFPGTKKDNAADRVAKRRHRGVRTNPDYLIRDMPDDLWRRVKQAAARREESIRDALLKLLEKYADREE